jgi:hypothetical protein
MGWTRNVAHMAKMRKHTQLYWEKFKETGHFGDYGIVWGMLPKDLGEMDTAGSEQCPGTCLTSINS